MYPVSLFKNGKYKIIRQKREGMVKVRAVVDEQDEIHAIIKMEGNLIKSIKNEKGTNVPDDKYIPIILLWIIENDFRIDECRDFLHFPRNVTLNGEECELIFSKIK